MKWGAVVALCLGLYLAYNLYDWFDPGSIQGKRVIITGASTGIGEQLVYHYCRLGAKLLITARTESRLREVIGQCRKLGSANGEYHYIPLDMSDAKSAEKLVKAAEEKLGGLDYVVLNHIMITPLGPWTGSQQNFTLLQRMHDVNFRAYVHISSLSLPLLEASGGSIVVVSSLAGKVAQPYVAPYSAYKFALDGFYSSLRTELQLSNSPVSVTLCLLGLIGTNNAVSALQNFHLDLLLKVVTPADPSDTALAILKGGALRHREVYYPYLSTRSFVMFRDVMPETLSFIMGILYGNKT